jgi:hypothetical protein
MLGHLHRLDRTVMDRIIGIEIQEEEYITAGSRYLEGTW